MNTDDLELLADEMISAGFFNHYISEPGYMVYFTNKRTISCFSNSHYPDIDLLLFKVGREVASHQLFTDRAIKSINEGVSMEKITKYVYVLGVLYLIRNGYITILYNPGKGSVLSRDSTVVDTRFGYYSPTIVEALKIESLLPDSALKTYYAALVEYILNPSSFHIQPKLLLINRHHQILPARLNVNGTLKYGYAVSIAHHASSTTQSDVMARVLATLLTKTLKQWRGWTYSAEHLSKDSPCEHYYLMKNLESWIPKVNRLAPACRLSLSAIMIDKGLDYGKICLTEDIPGIPVKFNLEEYEYR